MHKMQSASRVWKAALALFIGISITSGIAHAATVDSEGEGKGNGKAKVTNKAYIVQLAEPAVATYDGDIKGHPATRPNKGQKIDPNSPKVVGYMAYLAARHDALMAGVGATKKLYSYGYVFNGFAAELNAAQAQKLAETPGVLAVSKDELRSVDTATTPAFLGLSGASGFWNTTGATGENVIIGIVDSGIWAEHPSFSDRTGVNGNASRDGKLSYQQIPGWNGRCVPGEAFSGSDCNHKLIGARYYNSGFGGNAGVDARFPFEFNSPRDWGGHGTHTASTAGGNGNVAAEGDTAVFGNISGIAPRARIAVYKVCWADTPTGGGCFGSDSVAAIDQAVADGVDVINFSISGSRTNFRDAVEIAFLFAADAGVFVAASAGNSGPTTGTVAHPGPWLTTVAAGTHNRDGQGSAVLGNNVTYTGASFANALTSKSLIDSADAGLAGANPTRVELCYSAADNLVAGVPTPVLDPAKVAGKIVLCKRGATALVNKSGAVAAAGGAGAIIYNDPAGATNTLALMHPVPTVHVLAASGLAIKTYIAGSAGAATASISQAVINLNAPAPLTATFSSRGPLTAGGGNLLKPDIIGPGQDILAAVAPPGNNGRLFDLYSGTSMSSPHIAGIGALFKQLHPTWSPMAIKSALMTSAGDVLDGPNTNPLVIFRQGAGHVRPSNAVNPGLVFDSGFNDWLNFICGTQPGPFCSAYTPINPSNLNVASIAIGAMPGTQTVTRRVTNVSGAAATFTASTTGMAGFTVAVSPNTLTLAAGETKSFTVAVTRTTATLNAYAGGQLTWASATKNVRIPMVVRPVALAAPASVSGSYDVTFGYSGPFTATARGLVPSTVTAATVTQDPDSEFDPADTAGTLAYTVTVPAGTTHARFALFDADVAADSDIDLFVYRGTTLVGVSTAGGSTEEVNLVNPLAATYTVYVHGWGLPSGSSPFKLHTWLLGNTAAGNMTVTAPATAAIGATGAIGLAFGGLTPGSKYLGSVAYGGATGLPNPTIVRVDP